MPSGLFSHTSNPYELILSQNLTTAITLQQSANHWHHDRSHLQKRQYQCIQYERPQRHQLFMCQKQLISTDTIDAGHNINWRKLVYAEQLPFTSWWAEPVSIQMAMNDKSWPGSHLVMFHKEQIAAEDVRQCSLFQTHVLTKYWQWL